MSARPCCAHCRSRGGGRPRVRSVRLPTRHFARFRRMIRFCPKVRYRRKVRYRLRFRFLRKKLRCPRAIRTMRYGTGDRFRSDCLNLPCVRTVVLHCRTWKNCPLSVPHCPSLHRLRSQHLLRCADVRRSERRRSVKNRTALLGSAQMQSAKRSFRPDAVCRCDSFPPASVRLRCRIPVRPRDLPSGARTLPLYLQD